MPSHVRAAKVARIVSNRKVRLTKSVTKARRARPRYDRQLAMLWVGKVLVKVFDVPAENQRLILSAFEEEGWPFHLDDPLPPHDGIDPKKRLNDALRRLNQHHLRPLIRFGGDGTGRGIRWTYAHGGRR